MTSLQNDSSGPNIGIVCGQYLFREGIKTFLRKLLPTAGLIEIPLPETPDDRFQHETADILIIDMDAVDIEFSPELFGQILKHTPAATIAFVESHDTGSICQAIEAHVAAIILKNIDESELKRAIGSVLRGDTYYSDEVIQQLAHLHTGNKQTPCKCMLTTSEQEIIRLIGLGMTTKEIAGYKNLSFHTIISHRRNIFRKIAVNNSSEMLMYAIKHGIIETNDYYI